MLSELGALTPRLAKIPQHGHQGAGQQKALDTELYYRAIAAHVHREAPSQRGPGPTGAPPPPATRARKCRSVFWQQDTRPRQLHMPTDTLTAE